MPNKLSVYEERKVEIFRMVSVLYDLDAWESIPELGIRFQDFKILMFCTIYKIITLTTFTKITSNKKKMYSC